MNQSDLKRVGFRLEFATAPKKFKKVKTVGRELANRRGVEARHDVTVYMHNAGSPTFVVSVPTEYEQAWKNHRHKNHIRDRHHIADGWLHSPSFDSVLAMLDDLSFNYAEHYKSIHIRKVIQISVTLVAPKANISHDRPSFNSMRTLVGITSNVYWEVNGALYTTRGYFNEESDDSGLEPTYEDLMAAGRSSHGTIIPFTKEAWQTLCEIEATLERAATMLNKLVKPEQAAALLQHGLKNLLGAPESKA